jgi:hypothetical protein
VLPVKKKLDENSYTASPQAAVMVLVRVAGIPNGGVESRGGLSKLLRRGSKVLKNVLGTSV